MVYRRISATSTRFHGRWDFLNVIGIRCLLIRTGQFPLLVGLLSYRDDDIGPQQADLINLAIAKVKAAKEEYLKLENSRHEVELEFSSREFALYSLGENRRVISVEEVNSGGIVVKLVDSPDYSDIFCLSDCDPERLDVMVAQL